MHTHTALNQLLPFLRENKVELVFEATSVYSKPLEHFFETIGFNYYCLNPLEASFQTATLRQMKIDKADAHKLAISHLKFERKISISPSDKYKELKAISFSYHQIQDELLVNRNYLHTELEYTFPGVDRLYKDHLSKYVLNILEEYPHPAYVKAHSRTKIKKQLKKRILDQQIMEKTEWVQECANQAYSVVKKDDFRVKQVRRRIQNIRRLIDDKSSVRKELIKVVAELPDFALLESIPGIGELTSALLIIVRII